MDIVNNLEFAIWGRMFGNNINNREFSLSVKIAEYNCFYADIHKKFITRIKLVNIYNNDIFYLEIKGNLKNIDLLYISEGILFSQIEEFTSTEFVILEKE